MLINLKEERKCVEGILRAYADYTADTESPGDFHMWTALSIMSVAIGRGCYLDRGFYKIFPNLYILLVGESALVRKSTAIGIGMNIIRKSLGTELTVISQKISPQAMIKALNEKYKEKKVSSAFISSSEFAVFLGESAKDQSIIQVLTDLYDCPDVWSYTTILRGTEYCNNCYISLLAGSTPDWLKTAIPEESLGGGFLSRVLMVYREEGGPKVAFPEDSMTSSKRVLKEMIEHDLSIMSDMKGPFVWTSEAKNCFGTWYNEYNLPEKAPKHMRGYFGRKGDTAIKLAMLCSASHESSRIITDRDIMFGINMLTENEKFMEQVVSLMGQSKEGSKIDKVGYLIRKSGAVGIEHSRLQRSMSHFLNSDELRMAISTLEQGGMIEKQWDGRKHIYFYKG